MRQRRRPEWRFLEPFKTPIRQGLLRTDAEKFVIDLGNDRKWRGAGLHNQPSCEGSEKSRCIRRSWAAIASAVTTLSYSLAPSNAILHGHDATQATLRLRKQIPAVRNSSRMAPTLRCATHDGELR
jgi:hypothetical protein